MPEEAGRARLDATHAAADRLVREAQRQAEAAGGEPPREQVPPRGWATPGAGAASTTPDLAALLALIEALRDATPTRLAGQLSDALCELLIAVRALLDWYIERLGGPAGDRSPAEVRDIPLD